MKDLIAYIQALLNIKATTTLIYADMEQELSTVSNLVEYRKYLRDNINSYDSQYLTGFQKFIELTKKYKVIELTTQNSKRITNAQSEALKLSAKIEQITSTVLHHKSATIDFVFENFKTNSKDYFSSFEIKLLSSIGTIRECISLQRSKSGYDPLRDEIEKKMISIIVKPAQLSATASTKVLSLVRELV